MRRICFLAPGLTLLLVLACTPATGGIGDDTAPTETGDGDGDSGDGDGDTGDGDGDGDGDPGDGDGDGEGDGDGDGDGDGEGDGDGDGDGDPNCTELGCTCDGSPNSCDDGLLCQDEMCVLDLCGNGLVDNAPEQCDDGNEADGDSCDNDCTYTTIEVATGGLHTCAMIETGRVRCWGNATTGALGYGSTAVIGNDEAPNTAGDVGLPGGALAVELGGLFSCGLFEDDQMRCWGAGNTGQTGYAATTPIGDDELLADLPSIMLGGTATQFESGGSHTCTRLDTGDVRCWGGNSQGQLGVGTTTIIGDTEHPAMGSTVDLGPDGASFVAAGVGHSCAVTNMNELFCWGDNARGQLGYGSTDDIGNDEDPVDAGPVDMDLPALPNDTTITGLALGREHTCALFSSGDVACWGRNGAGQLGQGNLADWGDTMLELPSGLTPIDLGGSVTAITAGDDFTCALLDDGSIRCWGQNTTGQLGQGNTNTIGDNELPTAGMTVDVGGSAIQISAGGLHACAVLEDYSIVCWGEAGQGQLGYGNTNDIGNDEAPSAAGFISVL
jgi:alpha-tubulin suppressor-like RCC1 family protein